MKRSHSLVVAALLVVATLAVPLGTAAGTGIGIVSVETTTTPETPSPGDTVTISTTISNPESAGDSYALRKVEIRETTADDSTLYNASGRDATIGPGQSVTRDLGVQAEERGQQQYVVHIQLLSDGEVYNQERTVAFTVGQPDPVLSLSADPVGPANDTTFNLSVSNARSERISAVAIDLSSDDVPFTEDRRTISQLESGAQTVLRYPAANVSTGPKSVTATVEYTTANGSFVSTTESLSTTVEAVDNPGTVTLSGVDVRNVGGELRVRGQATNAGETPVEAVTVGVSEDRYSLGEAQSQTFVGSIEQGSATAFDVAVAPPTDATTMTIPLSVEYRVDGETASRLFAITYEPGAGGEVDLTGVSVERTGSQVTVRGSVSNLGTTNLSSVVVSVADGDRAGPAQSEASYFVGSVQQSDFKSFQVRATVGDTNETVSIPIEVQYRVDGQRVTETIDVSYTPSARDHAKADQRGSGAPIGLLGGVAVLVVAGGIVFKRYR